LSKIKLNWTGFIKNHENKTGFIDFKIPGCPIPATDPTLWSEISLLIKAIYISGNQIMTKK
jgi:hypothetical protein